MLLTHTNKYTVAHRTIKRNHLFLVDDVGGGIPFGNNSGLGLYAFDTRYVSCLEIALNDTAPIPLLSSTEAGHFSTIFYTNVAMICGLGQNEPHFIREESIQMKRESLLEGALFERYTLSHYLSGREPLRVKIRFTVAADFRDIFEVRHLEANLRKVIEIDTGDNGLVYRYKDEVGNRLATRFVFPDFNPADVTVDDVTGQVGFSYETWLHPRAPETFHMEIHPDFSAYRPQRLAVPVGFDDARALSRQAREGFCSELTRLHSDSEDLNEMLDRSVRDIHMLLTVPLDNASPGEQTGGQVYVAAGIPWYVALFGRDSLMTARDFLPLDPSLARSVLTLLARHQGQSHDVWREEAPGKILHELRVGELARLGRIPHTPYYGSADATPLWLMVLYDYVLWTADMDTLRGLWPNALAALNWVLEHLERPPGYVTYQRQSSQGLVHQGWKDSHDSAMYGDGTLAEPPVALVEIQGYAYLALRRMAELAELLGERQLSLAWRQAAARLKQRFNRDFWLPHLNYYAMGLAWDGEGWRPLDVISSNPGHCLETGILPALRAQKVMARLMAHDMFNGWGIRTLSSQCPAYNPMSYHNGSVWPHDNAMIVRGLVARGRADFAAQVFSGIFEAGRLMFYKRIPELFCGFSRDQATADPPVKYPVACSPQAWAASSVFAMVMALLNLSPRLNTPALVIRDPRLPQGVSLLELKDLKVHESQMHIAFKRSQNAVMLDVLDRHGRMPIVMEK